MKIISEQTIQLLNEKADFYNHIDFIADDPIQIPHRFDKKQDIEIAGFLSASIAWGNRKAIIKNAELMMSWMDETPYDFVLNFTSADLEKFPDKAVHRTFNMDDFKYFLVQFQRLYQEYDSLEPLFSLQNNETNFYHAIERFRNQFIKDDHRAKKHVSSPYKNSASKRIMMFLRWMVREDQRGVDFGIWKNIDQQYLSIPLDVHTANISRKLELITRKQNDWKTLEELDQVLRSLNKKDPSVYDFALFGLGVSKAF